jgi:hypothetical protein
MNLTGLMPENPISCLKPEAVHKDYQHPHERINSAISSKKIALAWMNFSSGAALFLKINLLPFRE